MNHFTPPHRSTIASIAFVMIVAVAVRWTSLSESFWVDELHSAWCVWDTPADVFSRSTMGHQSPVWFTGLWAWKQVVGENEFALRMFSVLAVAIGCGVLTGGVARISGRTVAGIAAGLAMAIESNSLFFGTELRPYSAVILFASVAAVCFARVWRVGSRRDAPAAWIGLCVSVGASVLCQPTSAGVLIALPIVLLSFRDFTRLDAVLIVASLLLAIGIWTTTLSESWTSRDTWAGFATATNWQQLWRAWDWVWLLIVPCFIGLILPKHRSLIAVLSLIVIATTTFYFAASFFGVMPIWHRRYFVAGLPMMACMIGLAVGSIEKKTITLPLVGGSDAVAAGEGLASEPSPAATASDSPGGRVLQQFVIAIGLLGGLVWSQGTFSSFPNRPLVVRGEDWRSAIELVADKSVADKSIVAIDAGLIESSWMADGELTFAQVDYLTFVAGGPYRATGEVLPIGPTLQGSDADWIVTRRPVDRIPAGAFPGAKRHRFGGVTVIELPKGVDAGLE